MVATKRVSIPKDSSKIPVSKAGQSTKHAVSPTSSPQSMSEEVLVLRARNKLLTQALAAIHSSSEKELKKRYDLVWFAKYRYRHPNHEASERIDKEYQEDIEKLRGEDGDFHHGFNSGVLAAARMAKSIAEVAKADDFETLTPELMNEAARLSKTIDDAQESFPDAEVTNNFAHVI